MSGEGSLAVCVFCGSSSGGRPEYAAAARALGSLLAQRGVTLVYGAGHVGLMGVLADAALAAGGRVVGVIPQGLVDRELAHSGLSELHIVRTMHERKALMADRSGAFLALPGGYGTADELFEILTWAQLGIHDKPIGLLNVAGYFDPLLAWLDRAVQDRFVRAEHRLLLQVGEQPETLVDSLIAQARRGGRAGGAILSPLSPASGERGWG
jgi:uncharacterized protein (TIGR00730 family)